MHVCLYHHSIPMLEIKSMEAFLRASFRVTKAGVKVTVAYNEVWPLFTMIGKSMKKRS